MHPDRPNLLHQCSSVVKMVFSVRHFFTGIALHFSCLVVNYFSLE